MHLVAREFRFEAAHRLLNHGGKCKDLHGHSYKVTIFVEGPLDPATGMVIDFADLKDTVGKWIDLRLDHNVILNKRDPLVTFLGDSGARKPFLTDGDPTAEVLADVLADTAACFLINLPVKVRQVVVQETENCRAFRQFPSALSPTETTS